MARLLGLVLVTSHHVRGDGKINVNNPQPARNENLSVAKIPGRTTMAPNL